MRNPARSMSRAVITLMTDDGANELLVDPGGRDDLDLHQILDRQFAQLAPARVLLRCQGHVRRKSEIGAEERGHRRLHAGIGFLGPGEGSKRWCRSRPPAGPLTVHISIQSKRKRGWRLFGIEHARTNGADGGRNGRASGRGAGDQCLHFAGDQVACPSNGVIGTTTQSGQSPPSRITCAWQRRQNPSIPESLAGGATSAARRPSDSRISSSSRFASS